MPHLPRDRRAQPRQDRERVRLRLRAARPRRVLHAPGAALAAHRRPSASTRRSRSKASCACAAASRAARCTLSLEILSHARERAQRRRAEAASQRPAPRKATLVPPRIAYRRELERWAVPMPTIDPEVVLRSAQLMGDYGPDFHYGHYLALAPRGAGRRRGDRRRRAVCARAVRADEEAVAAGQRPGRGPEREGSAARASSASRSSAAQAGTRCAAK